MIGAGERKCREFRRGWFPAEEMSIYIAIRYNYCNGYREWVKFAQNDMQLTHDESSMNMNHRGTIQSRA
jgi:hypothetical protein